MASPSNSFPQTPPVKEDKFYRARIIERKDFSSDLWRIRVDPGGEFHYAPGQYATLGVHSPSKHVERPYSIVSSPYEDFLEFFIELVPQGELTPLLYELQVGDTFTCRRVSKGRFTLDTKSGRTNHLLLATVTGIARFVSYVRSLHRDSKRSPVAHRLFPIEGASHSWEFGYREEMEQFAAKVLGSPTFPQLAALGRTRLAWRDGRVDDLIRKYTDLRNLIDENSTAYLCGHPTMIENGKGILHHCSWQNEGIKEEVYFTSGKQSTTERTRWWPWSRHAA